MNVQVSGEEGADGLREEPKGDAEQREKGEEMQMPNMQQQFPQMGMQMPAGQFRPSQMSPAQGYPPNMGGYYGAQGLPQMPFGASPYSAFQQGMPGTQYFGRPGVIPTQGILPPYPVRPGFMQPMMPPQLQMRPTTQ